MSVIGIGVEKGGVGKTTLAVHFSVALAQRGKRVILLDADPQGNATSWLLGTTEHNDVYNLLMTPGDPASAARRAVRSVPNSTMGIVSSNQTTSDAIVMLSAVGRLKEITERVGMLGALCDVLIIDMPPSRNAGFLDILRACEWIVVPTQLERHSVEGVSLIARTVQQLRAESSGPRLLGIVPNQADIRTVLHRTQMAELMKAFGQSVWPAIPDTIKVPEVASVGSTLFAEYPNETVTRKLSACVSRMMEVLYGAQKSERTPAISRAGR